MKNPYAGKPDHQFWRRSVSGLGATEVDPVVRVPFGIGPIDQVATADAALLSILRIVLKAQGFTMYSRICAKFGAREMKAMVPFVSSAGSNVTALSFTL